jgi:hypothetical protein
MFADDRKRLPGTDVGRDMFEHQGHVWERTHEFVATINRTLNTVKRTQEARRVRSSAEDRADRSTKRINDRKGSEKEWKVVSRKEEETIMHGFPSRESGIQGWMPRGEATFWPHQMHDFVMSRINDEHCQLNSHWTFHDGGRELNKKRINNVHWFASSARRACIGQEQR